MCSLHAHGLCTAVEYTVNHSVRQRSLNDCWSSAHVAARSAAASGQPELNSISFCLLLQAVPGLSQEHQDTIYGLFDSHVDAGLAWVRKEGSEYIPSVDNNLATSLAMIMQVCLCRYKKACSTGAFVCK